LRAGNDPAHPHKPQQKTRACVAAEPRAPTPGRAGFLQERDAPRLVIEWTHQEIAMKRMWLVVGALAMFAGCAEQPTAARAPTSQLGAGPAPESTSQSAHGAAVAAGLGYHGPVDHTDRRVGD
jgi:hypothetical protein